MSDQYPTFKTKHLLFRQLQISDVNDVFSLFSDPKAMDLDGGQTMNNLNDAYQFIRHYSQFGSQINFIRWALVSNVTGEFYGTAGFHNWDRMSQSAEIGGELSKSYWNKGIASEGYKNLITFGFSQMGLNRIYAYVNPTNTAARHIMEKGPFQKEGYLRQCRRWGNKLVDLEIFGLLKEDLTNNMIR